MKKILLTTVALAGLSLTACANKDSYLAGKAGGGGGGGGAGGAGGPQALSAQQKALEVLSQDKRFTSVSENALSGKLKDSTSSQAFEIKTDEATSTIEISVLNKNSKNCVADTKTFEGFSLEALRKGLKINGVGRVQCVEAQGDCNDLILIVEKTIDQFAGGSMPSTTLQASTAIFLSKDETGVYKPVKSEDETFAQAMTLEEKMQDCLKEQSATDAKNAPELQNPRIREALKANNAKITTDIKNTELSNPKTREALKANESKKLTAVMAPELSQPRVREALKANAAAKEKATVKNSELSNPKTIQGLKEKAPLEVVDPVADGM